MDDLNTPERQEFYAAMKARQKMVRYTFAVTVDIDRNSMKADPEATIKDAISTTGIKVVRVKQLPETT